MKLGFVAVVVLSVTGCAMVNKPVMTVSPALELSGFKAGADACKDAGLTYSFNDKYYNRAVDNLRSRFEIDSEIEAIYNKEVVRKRAYYDTLEIDDLKVVCSGLNDKALFYMNSYYRMKREYEVREAEASANFSRAMSQVAGSLQSTGQKMHNTGRAALQRTTQSMPVSPSIYVPQTPVAPPAVRNRMENLSNSANRLETRSVLTKSTFHQGMYQCDYANGQRRFSYTGCSQFWGG